MSKRLNDKRISKNSIIWVLSVLMLLLLSGVIVWLVGKNEKFPSGSYTYYYLYRAEYLHDSIVNDHNWFPLFDYSLYNGVELLRYRTPLLIYIIALFLHLFNGDAIAAYKLLIGCMVFFGGINWIYIGVKYKKPVRSMIIGLLWFLLPPNLRYIFVEGNLSIAFCTVLLPAFVIGLFEYLQSKRVKALVITSVLFIFITLIDLKFAGIVIVASMIITLSYALINRKYGTGFRAIVAFVISFFTLGVYVLPTIISDGVSVTSRMGIESAGSQTFGTLFLPLYRVWTNNDCYYLCMSVIALILFGIMFGYRKDSNGFLIAAILMVVASDVLRTVFDALMPDKTVSFLDFLPVALCVAFLCFVKWDRLRRIFVALILLLIIADSLPSFKTIYGDAQNDSSELAILETYEDALVESAVLNTSQRVALLDQGTQDSKIHYAISGMGHLQSSFGFDWSISRTGNNILNLNKALSEGKYLYLFDRLLEMGNDTVILKLSELAKNTDLSNVEYAANQVGYEILEKNEEYVLFKIDVPKCFGTITDYRGIAIGTSAASISRDFPSIKETTDTNLNHYSFEELSEYETIFLSGFTYDDKKTAEDMVLKLSEADIKIVILADGIPEDRASYNQSFLGVICNPISFSNGYPLLDTIYGELDTDLFPAGYTEWSTVFVDGLDKIYGTVRNEDYRIPFYGTVKNDNIVVIALNLTYYYSLTMDTLIGNLLADVMDGSLSAAPSREIIPLEITKNSREMLIKSPKDNVNTSISYHDIFYSNSEIREENNLLFVDEGKTYIKYEYPHFALGILVSVISTIILVLYFVYLNNLNRFYSNKEISVEKTT